jgi:predicted small metal-binding protein
MTRGDGLAITSSTNYFKIKREVKAMATDSKEYKELSCRDFKADCDFMVRAETADEVMKYCQQHACDSHGKCASSSENREKIKSRIRSVRV